MQLFSYKLMDEEHTFGLQACSRIARRLAQHVATNRRQAAIAVVDRSV